MKHTLLTLVNDMLGAIDAEGVDAVTDTEESALCVSIANRAFEAIIYKAKWKHLRVYTTLTAGSANNQLTGPSNTIHINSRTVFYDGEPVRYVYPEDFIALTQTRTVGTNLSVVGGIKTITNQNPNWFTSFDDTTLVFDATPTTSALTPASSNAMLWIGPSERVTSDNGVFDLPAPAYPILEDWAIGIAVGELKGDTDTAKVHLREADRKLATMTQKGDLVEKNPDILKNIITRRSSINRKLINVGDIST